MTSDQFLSYCYFYVLSLRSELRYSGSGKIPSYTIYSFALFHQIRLKQLIVIRHWNGFNCFLASNCNKSWCRDWYVEIIVTIFFLTLFCYRNRSFSFVFFIFIGTFFRVSFNIPTVLSCMIFGVLVNCRNYSSIDFGLVSVEVQPVLEQWLLFH
jgi:hypothetical protein